MIAIERIEDGYRITITEFRWTYWVYPDLHEIYNNGERFKARSAPVSPRLTLLGNWTMGTVLDQILIQCQKKEKQDEIERAT